MEQLTYPEHSDNAEIEVINELIKKLESAINILELHAENIRNPHDVLKEQVGLGNVDNTSDVNKPVSTAQATAIADAKKAGTDAQNNLNSHITDTTKHITSTERAEWSSKANANHLHTKSQITDFPASMPASDVYSWAKQSTKPTYTASEVGAAVTMTHTISVPNTSWILNENDNIYYQNITCQGLLDSDNPILDVLMSTFDADSNKEYADAWSHILFATATTDQLTIVTDGALPSVSFQIKVKVVR